MQIVAGSGKGHRTANSQLANHHGQSVQSRNTQGQASQQSQNPLTREMIVSKHKLKSNDLT